MTGFTLMSLKLQIPHASPKIQPIKIRKLLWAPNAVSACILRHVLDRLRLEGHTLLHIGTRTTCRLRPSASPSTPLTSFPLTQMQRIAPLTHALALTQIAHNVPSRWVISTKMNCSYPRSGGTLPLGKCPHENAGSVKFHLLSIQQKLCVVDEESVY